MKSVFVAMSCMLLSSVAFADGKSMGADAAFVANFIRRPDVSRCIQKVESEQQASSYIKDIRKLDDASGSYEITLNLVNIDIMKGSVDVVLTPKPTTDPFTRTWFECSVKYN